MPERVLATRGAEYGIRELELEARAGDTSELESGLRTVSAPEHRGPLAAIEVPTGAGVIEVRLDRVQP